MEAFENQPQLKHGDSLESFVLNAKDREALQVLFDATTARTRSDVVGIALQAALHILQLVDDESTAICLKRGDELREIKHLWILDKKYRDTTTLISRSFWDRGNSDDGVAQ